MASDDAESVRSDLQVKIGRKGICPLDKSDSTAFHL